MSKYSRLNLFENVFSLIFTKLFYPKARLIRRPIYIRGKKGFIYGEGLTLGHGCRIDASDINISLKIGKNARIGDYVHINANENITIGDNVLIASKVFISDANHGQYNGELQSSPDINPSERQIFTSPVIIGANVWIGENVVILAGSKIGSGSIIGANSVINGSEFLENVIIVGAPGKVIKKYNYTTKKWEKFEG